MFNLANLLTMSRIAVIPLFIATFYFPDRWGPWGHWAGLGLFVLAGVTDFLDGYVARSQNLVSAMGRFLDPIADKLLVAASLLTLVWLGIIGGWSLWAALVILCREVLVSGLREFLAELRVSVPVTQLAKYKTAMQMVAIGILLAGPAGEAVLPGTLTLGLGCLWISALLTLYTGYDYFRAGIRHLIDKE